MEGYYYFFLNIFKPPTIQNVKVQDSKDRK